MKVQEETINQDRIDPVVYCGPRLALRREGVLIKEVGTLNGSENFVRYDVWVVGMCSAEFCNPQLHEGYTDPVRCRLRTGRNAKMIWRTLRTKRTLNAF